VIKICFFLEFSLTVGVVIGLGGVRVPGTQGQLARPEGPRVVVGFLEREQLLEYLAGALSSHPSKK